MKPQPIQARALKKRSDLIEAAEACFAQHGFDNTTAKSIADYAKVATGTFYQYFENKEDMLRVIAIRRMESIEHQLPQIPKRLSNPDKVKMESLPNTEHVFLQVLELIYKFHIDAPELHQILEQRRDIDPKLGKILDQGETLLNDRVLMFVKLFKVKQAKTVAFNLFAMAEGLIHRQVFRGNPRKKKETLNLGAKMLAAYFESIS